MKRPAVYLIGTGPGDPGLITVRGLEHLRTADVVVYDHLVPARLLTACAPGRRADRCRHRITAVFHGAGCDQLSARGEST